MARLKPADCQWWSSASSVPKPFTAPQYPDQSPSCFSWPLAGLLFSQAPFLCFCHSPNVTTSLCSHCSLPRPSSSDKVPQSQEGFSHQQGHAVPPPSTPHAPLSSLPLAEHVLPQRQLCTFLISPREKTGTALDTNSGSARAQLCHLVYVTSPLHTSVSSSVRWGVAINLRRPTLIKVKAPSSGPGRHPVGIATTLPGAWGAGRTLAQLLLPTILPAL